MAGSAAHQYKATIRVRPRVKALVRENATLKPRKAKQDSRQVYRAAKKNYKLKRQDYIPLKGKTTLNAYVAKKASYEAKLDKKVAKKVYQKAKKRASQSGVGFQARALAKNNFQYQLERHIGEDDIVEGVVDARQKQRQTEFYLKSNVRLAKGLGKMAVGAGKHTYGLGNRVYHLARGRGFYRTPEQFSAVGRARRRFRAFKNRLGQSKAGKVAHGTSTLGKFFFRNATHPLKVKGFLVLGVLIAVLSLFFMMTSASTKPAIVQDDFELTNSWTAMTKLDAENSGKGNSFYTALDDVMFYMNYKYDDYDPKGQYASADEATDSKGNVIVKNISYADIMSRLWTALNGSPPHYKLTTMDSLLTSKGSGYFMSPNDYADYNEIKNALGYQSLEGQLAFPFQTDNLIVVRRYGYEKTSNSVELFPSMTAQVAQGTTLTAPMTGKVTVESPTTVMITQDDNLARLTLDRVTTARLQSGQEISSGTLIGTATQNTLVITYEKYNSNDKQWETVNPGFYFPKVTYAQITSLAADDFKPDKSMLGSAQAIYDTAKKQGFSLSGIAAVLGCWQVESGIDPTSVETIFDEPFHFGAEKQAAQAKGFSMAQMDPAYSAKYPAIVQAGIGFGQWTNDRDLALQAYAQSQNQKWYDATLQINFALTGDSPGAISALKNTLSAKVASSVPDLTAYFLTYWEGVPGDKLAERIADAQNWYNYFTNQSSSSNGTASSDALLSKYGNQMKPLPTSKEVDKGQGWPGNDYASGQCTWYVYNREAQLGHSIDAHMGNGGQWGTTYTQTPGAVLDAAPQAGDAVSFAPGVAGASGLYGHVAVVEVVNSDGSFVVSEMNYNGQEYQVHYRLLTPQGGESFIHFN